MCEHIAPNTSPQKPKTEKRIDKNLTKQLFIYYDLPFASQIMFVCFYFYFSPIFSSAFNINRKKLHVSSHNRTIRNTYNLYELTVKNGIDW